MFLHPPKSKPIAALLDQCRKAFWLVAAGTFLAELISLAPILYTLNMYDRVLTSRSEVTLISLTGVVLAMYAFWGMVEWLRGRLLIRISMRIDWELATKLFDASFRRHVTRREINVHQVLGDLVQLRQFMTGTPMLALMSAPFAVLFIVICALFHPYLAMFCLAATLVLLFTTYLTSKATTSVLAEANVQQGRANKLAAASLQQSEATLGLGMRDALRARWYRAHQQFLGQQAQASEAQGILGGFSGFLSRALQSLATALGVFLAINGLITGGMVMAATFLITKTLTPLQLVMGAWKDITAARQAYARLDALLEEDVLPETQVTLPAPSGKLVVEGMTVVPPGAEATVLQNIQFSLEPGDALAIVGPSASGKSSLVRMLVGLWKPSQGHVRLDGAELYDWARAAIPVGQHVGYLSQDIGFFEGTVAENIARMGAPESDQVIHAAKLAGVHEAILSFPQGYETQLGELGHMLTGGQRQRIALARAMYGSPRYLVLDEPNSALDEAAERALVAVLQAYRAAGNTIIFTTHRPMLISAATKLMVLAAGRQAAYGPIKDVLATIAPQPVQAEGG
ncbi:ATP-binding cassette, subfamily C, bacterial exporter for protease/lipase [Novimethylophilus kurashikiensis]|uniref:ATP-binding cassette, subfamily C, bacterial exporter for protease/lipase n=1 Tax=Novimethylophilus kurashikiensis TaxID=1825523 RepID=A0A2R5FA55_9PROT|nr:type I secretion system permease/ATPase [Novimethylophilus kurashikiensis]GBG14428.1 ATP-binding cassette, subfamily C, bacterial exporter for protease/lipase [Novimethylophilus kurashikiensis]